MQFELNALNKNTSEIIKLGFSGDKISSLVFVQSKLDPFDSMCLSNNLNECEIICKENNGLLTQINGQKFCSKFSVFLKDCQTNLSNC